MPEPNIRGRDIKIVDLGVPSPTEPSPTILPRSPLNFVIDDCDGFTWFNGSETMIDQERGLLVEGWTDPGLDNKNRTLTIYALSPSCRNHAKVVQFFFYSKRPSPHSQHSGPRHPRR